MVTGLPWESVGRGGWASQAGLSPAPEPHAREDKSPVGGAGIGKTSKYTVPSGCPHPLVPLLNCLSREACALPSLNKRLLNTYYVLGLCSVLRIQQQQVPEHMGLYLKVGDR